MIFKRGITVNMGKVEGGIGPNTVSEFCTAQIDFRYVAPEDFHYIESRIIEYYRHNHRKRNPQQHRLCLRPPSHAADI